MTNPATQAKEIAVADPGFTSIGFDRLVWDPKACVRYHLARWMLRQLAYAEVLDPLEIARAHIEVAASIGWFLVDSEVVLDPTPRAPTTVDVKQRDALLRCATAALHTGGRHGTAPPNPGVTFMSAR